MKRLFVIVALASALASPARADESVPPRAPAAFDMDSWESQVLGAIFGTYCGYYPTRVTLVGRSIGLTKFSQCQKLYQAIAPACVAKMKSAGRWHVGSSEEGTALGRDIGACIDEGYAKATGGAR